MLQSIKRLVVGAHQDGGKSAATSESSSTPPGWSEKSPNIGFNPRTNYDSNAKSLPSDRSSEPQGARVIELWESLARVDKESQKELLKSMLASLDTKQAVDSGLMGGRIASQKKGRKTQQVRNMTTEKKEEKHKKLTHQEQERTPTTKKEEKQTTALCGQLNREGRPCQRKEGPLHCPYHGTMRERPKGPPPESVSTKEKGSKKDTPPSKRKLPWSWEEHLRFLEGLKRWGTGSIAAEQISKLIGTRSATAVKNYSQRYHEYQRRGVKLANNNYNFTLEDWEKMQKEKESQVTKEEGEDGDAQTEGSKEEDSSSPQMEPRTITLFGFQIPIKSARPDGEPLTASETEGKDSSEEVGEGEDEEEDEDEEDEKQEEEEEEEEYDEDLGASGVDIEETEVDDFIFRSVLEPSKFGSPKSIENGVGHTEKTLHADRNGGGGKRKIEQVTQDDNHTVSPPPTTTTTVSSGEQQPDEIRDRKKRRIAEDVLCGLKYPRETVRAGTGDEEPPSHTSGSASAVPSLIPAPNNEHTVPTKSTQPKTTTTQHTPTPEQLQDHVRKLLSQDPCVRKAKSSTTTTTSSPLLPGDRKPESIEGVRKAPGGGVEYFIRWKGLTAKDNTWLTGEIAKQIWPKGNYRDWDLF